MKLGLLFVLFLGVSINLSAQEIDFSKFKGMNMRSIGPAGMSGRITSIDAENNDPNKIIIGSASGGVWQSVNAGLSWKPIFDDQSVLGIGSVTIQQSNPDVIWVGTGEGNPRNSHTCGAGIFKSIDGGKSWSLMGLEKTITIHKIIIDETNPNIVYAGCVGSPWGANEERGVYKTIDGGKTWKKILYVNDLTGCADLIIDPSNPNKLFAAMWEHKREPWFFNSGGEGSGMYVTYDGGEKWKRVSKNDGLPDGKLGRIGLAVAPSNPDIVYALIESSEYALYKSTNGGNNWKKMSTKNVGNRPFYYATLYVDPKNENRIYSLHTLITKSEDGGKSFDVIIPYTGAGVHPDHHALWINPNNPKHIINGNDGGLNITHDGARTWRFIENIPVAQFYHINIDNDFPYNVYGGMQDNGSYIGPSQVTKSGGISNFEWQEVLFGDGFDVMPDPSDSRYGYAMYQKGNVYRYDKETGKTEYIQPNHPEGVKLRYNWNGAMAQDPQNPKGIYFGSQFVHYSRNQGKDWKIISPDLTTNDSTKQRQSESGGLSLDATGAENHTTILAIAPSPLDKDLIWVGTDDGNVQVTKDGGVTWNNVSEKITGPKTGFWVPQIEVSKTNKNEAFIIINDYRRNDFETYVYHTKDAGATFIRIADNKNVNGYALSIVQDPTVENLLFLGTENGLYISIDYGVNWTQWKEDYPSVSTMDMKIQEREADLVIGTFGRAIYILEDISPLRMMAKEKGKLIEKEFEVFGGGDAFQMHNSPATGVRFAADGYFKGSNTSSNARLNVWIKEPGDPAKRKKEEDNSKSKKSKKTTTSDVPEKEEENEEKSKIIWDKINVDIISAAKDTLYTYTVKVDTGLQTVTWHLNQRGIAYPNRKKIDKDAKDRWGSWVLPGVYNMSLTYGTYTSTKEIIVKSDPRIEFNKEHALEKQQLLQKHQKTVSKASDLMQKLVEMKANIQKINTYFESSNDSIKKEIEKEGKLLTDSIHILQNLFNQDPSLSGYQDNSDKLNTALYHAQEAVSSLLGPIGNNAKNAVKNAEDLTEKIEKQILKFRAVKWKKYIEFISEKESSALKEFHKLIEKE